MKRLLVLAGCAILLVVLASCSRQNLKSSNLPKPTVQENEFPDFLVGVWKADQYEWAFQFERDGTISRLVHTLGGPIKMEEGGDYMEGPDPGTFAYFAIGPCEAKYNPENRQLSLKIFLDAFHMRLPAGDLEGRMEDYFDGPVSEDGKTWTASWRDYCWLEGADPPDPNVVEANPEKLIFTKTKIE